MVKDWQVFAKSQFASLLATVLDYAVFLAFLKVFGVWYVLASGFGNLSGAVFHFSFSRVWVFDARKERIRNQALKYFLISGSSLLVNSLLIFILKEFFVIKPEFAKMISAFIVGIAFNYPLFRHFVFRKDFVAS